MRRKNPRRSRLSFQSRSIRFLASACVVGAVLLAGHIAPVAAPGGSPRTYASGPPTRKPYYLLAADGGGTGISVYAVRGDGSLRAEAGPFAADEGPAALVVGPADHFLYVANEGERSRRHHYGDVTAYSIGADGLLRELPRSPFYVGGILQSLVINPNGKQLYTFNSHGIWHFATQPNGSIKLSSRSPVRLDRGVPQGLVVTPNGAYLYAADFTLSPNGAVSGFSIGPDGVLTRVVGSPVADGGSPTGAIATTPDGSDLFIGNRRNVTVYSVHSDGTLRLVGSRGDVDATAIIVGTSGHFLYAADEQTGTLRVYRIHPGGRLATLGGPVSTGAHSFPDALVLTPDGHFLYVADNGSNAISAYRVGPAGALHQVAGSPYSSPRGPDALTIVASRRPRTSVAAGAGSATANLPSNTTPEAAGPLSSTQTPPGVSCRRDPLAGVYHPWRLHINDPCVTVSGIVEHVKTEPDHDWHVNLRLPPSSQHLLDAANRKWEHGDLVVEIIPMDQPHIPRPKVGERISVIGAYVLDSDHGWEEIHPAWLVDGSGSVHYSVQAASRSVKTGIQGNESYFGKRD